MDKKIGDLLDIASKVKRDEIFAEFPETKKSLTFGALDAATKRVGCYLKGKGLKEGENVGIIMRNGEEMVKIMLGVIRSGFVAVSINPYDSIERIRYIIERSEASIVLILEEFKDVTQDAITGIDRNIDIISVDKEPNDIFNMDISSFKETEFSNDKPALLLYTSGSTGRPKGVLLSHKNLVTNAGYVKEAHLLTQKDKALCVLPLFHINGFVFTLIAPLLTFGKVVMPHKFHVKNFWELISEYKTTWVSVVPTILSFLLHDHEVRKTHDYDCKELRFVRSASMMLPIEIQKRFEKTFDCIVIDTLGITEASGQVFSNPPFYEERRYGSVGVPYGNRVKVIDEDGNELGDGQAGEIVIKGYNLMLGYYKDEALTKESFIDGWLKTGDMGYRDEDGYYFITGRKKEIIIRGGENISPAEIDNILYRHPAVHEAAAVGVPDEAYGEEIKAFVVLKRHVTCTEDEILEFCRVYLPEYKSPKTVEFVHKLPKGPSGKILRLKLAEEGVTMPEKELI